MVSICTKHTTWITRYTMNKLVYIYTYLFNFRIIDVSFKSLQQIIIKQSYLYPILIKSDIKFLLIFIQIDDLAQIEIN